ncbi:MAG: Ig-like domain-containing protein [Cytophagales bacterium]|nr:Ig-like domain-containing protein [Cytophagales bacterium]
MKQYLLSSVTTFLFMLQTSYLYSATITVSNPNELQLAVSSALAGDVILLADGTYSNFHLTISRSGTSGNYITVKAQNAGQAKFRGNVGIVITGNYVKISGFDFEGATLHPNSANLIRLAGNHNIVEDMLIKGVSNGSFTQHVYVKADKEAKYNTVRRCWFERGLQHGMAVFFDGAPVAEGTFNTVEWCYFRAEREGSNGGSAIRLGGAGTVNPDGPVLRNNVRNNLFDRYHGESETIAVKGSENNITNNTMLNCRGFLSLRAGRDNIVRDNFLINNDPNVSPKWNFICIWGDNHLIENNYIHNSIGENTSTSGSITFITGTGEVGTAAHEAPENVTVKDNIIYEVDGAGYAIAFGHKYQYGSQAAIRTLMPHDITLTGNYVYSNDATPRIYYHRPCNNITWSGNKVWQNAGTNEPGISEENPNLVEDSYGIFRADGKGPSGNPLTMHEVGPIWINNSTDGNVALNKPASQSSTDLDRVASRAVDGSTNGVFNYGSVTHTANETNPWWEVDLEGVYNITDIKVYNRTDCCGESLANYHVFVSDVAFTSTDLNTTINQAGVGNFYQSAQADTPTTIAVNRSGRYVRVQLAGTNALSISEVQVMTDDIIPVIGVSVYPTSLSLAKGETSDLAETVSPSNATDRSVSWSSSNTAVATVNSNGLIRAVTEGSTTITVTTTNGFTATCTVMVIAGGAVTNAALNKPASQSSTDYGGVPERALDGNTHGVYSGGSVTHTTNESHPWWEVDLESVYSITDINIYNRTDDCCRDRLANYHVFVSDVPFTSTDLNTTINQSGVGNFYQSSQAGTPTTIAVNRSGRYVRVQLVGTNVLSIAEVQVMTNVPVIGVSVYPTSLSLVEGETSGLMETVSPSNATDKSVSWSSDNTAVATVDTDGLVTAVAEGEATITVTTTDRGFTATSAVTVSAIPVTGVSASPTFQVNIYPNPLNKGDLNVGLTLSSNSDIALRIFNIMGNMIYSETIGNYEPGNYMFTRVTHILNIHTPGVYMIEVTTNGVVERKKLILT